MATFNTKEYAFLETALPNVKCCHFGEVSWTPCYQIKDGYIEFIGKRAGNVKLSNPNANDKIESFKKKYEDYKKETEKIINSYSG